MISVVVPAYNEEKTISKCLEAVSGQDCELIVVVGGSDNTAKIAEKYGRVIVDRKCAGAGTARNMGASAARGEIVLFTDGDTIVSEKWVEQYARVFSDKRIVGAGGIVRPRGGNRLDSFIYMVNQDLFYRLTAIFGFYQLSGNNCGYRTSVFKKLGGFDEEMGLLEDTELPMRMKKAGKIFVGGKIVVWTSVRRMKTKGYLKTGLQFIWSYAGWFFFKKKPMGDYFASAAGGKLNNAPGVAQPNEFSS